MFKVFCAVISEISSGSMHTATLFAQVYTLQVCAKIAIAGKKGIVPIIIAKFFENLL
jgi:hypothetical protein